VPDAFAEPRPIIPTGDRPPGPHHLRRLCGSLRNRVALQHDHDPFVQIADGQALTDDAVKAGLITRHMLALALNELVVGIDPNFTTICLRLTPPALCEPTRLFLDLVTVGPFVCTSTIEEEDQTYGFGCDIPSGCACYQVAQTADIAAFRATLVLAGVDQAPMIEQDDEIVLCLGWKVGQALLPEARAPIPESRRLLGVGGRAEMSVA
jgi:tryptophanyl-tRNA synthetase